MKIDRFINSFCIIFVTSLTLFGLSTANAIDRCYGGAGLGSIGQDIYRPAFTEENTLISPREKLLSKSSMGVQLFAGCNLYENIDVEVGTIINKDSSFFDPSIGRKAKVSQRSFMIDAILKALSFDNGMQFYGKLGGGFFMNQFKSGPLIALDDRFGLHAAGGLSYPITDEVKLRAEYHYFPKGKYYEAQPITVNLTYQFD